MGDALHICVEVGPRRLLLTAVETDHDLLSLVETFATTRAIVFTAETFGLDRHGLHVSASSDAVLVTVQWVPPRAW